MQSFKRGRPVKTPTLSSPLYILISKPISIITQLASLPIQDLYSVFTTNNCPLRPRQISSCIVKQVFIDNYKSKKTVVIYFPLILSNHSTHIVIGRFQSDIDNVVMNTKNVCASCRLFISFENLQYLHHSHQILLTVFESRVVMDSDLDHYDKSKHYIFFYIIYY